MDAEVAREPVNAVSNTGMAENMQLDTHGRPGHVALPRCTRMNYAITRDKFLTVVLTLLRPGEEQLQTEASGATSSDDLKLLESKHLGFKIADPWNGSIAECSQ